MEIMNNLSENANKSKSKYRAEFDDRGNQIYEEDASGWVKTQYDNQNNIILREFKNGYWSKKEYEEGGYNRIIKATWSDGRSLEYNYENDGSYYLKNHKGEITYVPFRETETADLLNQVGASINLLGMAIFARALQIQMPHMNFTGAKMKGACEGAYFQEYTPELKYWSDLCTANKPPLPDELILLIKHYVSSESYESAAYFRDLFKKKYPGLKLEL